VYASGEPAAEFHARITFCLDLHNEAVRSMRYPADAHKAKSALETAEQRKERQALEAELAEAMEEGDDMF
jgi:26S proteasome regulatory subunit N3